MAANQPSWPRLWLMTDERIGAGLFEAIARLPDGQGGIIFRHYRTPGPERAALALRIAEHCHERGLTLGVAGDPALASAAHADLVHNPVEGAGGLLPASRSAHSAEEARAAVRAGAALLFLSPIFPTRSHPDRPALSQEERRAILAETTVPVIALGGMSARRFAERKDEGFYGWAGIDAWLGKARI